MSAQLANRVCIYFTVRFIVRFVVGLICCGFYLLFQVNVSNDDVHNLFGIILIYFSCYFPVLLKGE